MAVTDDVTVVKMMPSHKVKRRDRCDEDVDAVDAMKTWSWSMR